MPARGIFTPIFEVELSQKPLQLADSAGNRGEHGQSGFGCHPRRGPRHAELRQGDHRAAARGETGGGGYDELVVQRRVASVQGGHRIRHQAGF